MRGYVYRSTAPPEDTLDNLNAWEELAVNAVGHVIDFWGFKHNYGRIWALLYLRDEPMSSSDLQEALDLSKGSVSMMTRELEQWAVIHRVKRSGSAAWHFVAEVDFLKMMRRVLREREFEMVERVIHDLRDAREMARRDEDADDEIVDRIDRMVRLADMVLGALKIFLRTARLDVAEAEDIL
jgi:DNA-binding transcriptional regulator GbsR (MarR family)